MTASTPQAAGPHRPGDQPPPAVSPLRRLGAALRGERLAGTLLVAGAILGLVFVNSPIAGLYESVRDLRLGPAALHLDLSVGHWASDGLLAIFFLVVGLELKQELVTGQLSRLSPAIVPVVAAVGGMAVPACLYLLLNHGGAHAHGWAVPTATDIAFAVSVLALVARRLPVALRAFLLTLAVVDDLLGILIIAAVYTDGLALGWLAAAAVCVAAFAVLVRRGITRWFLLIPLGVLAWAFMHASGIHATIAGVALAMTVPARPLARHRVHPVPAVMPGGASLAQVFEHRWRPVSAGIAVPVFALFAAGVPVTGSALAGAAADPVFWGVMAGLILGKPVGITLATWLVTRVPGVRLSPGLGWLDVMGVSVLGGIGFTVSMLIAELAFGAGSLADEHAKMGILVGSVIAALVGAVALSLRGRAHAVAPRAEP